MLESITGNGPWRITPQVGFEVWQAPAGPDGGYAYCVSEGAPILYAAKVYAEAKRICNAAFDVWDESTPENGHTDEQAYVISDWYGYAYDAYDAAHRELLRVILETM